MYDYRIGYGPYFAEILKLLHWRGQIPIILVSTSPNLKGRSTAGVMLTVYLSETFDIKKRHNGCCKSNLEEGRDITRLRAWSALRLCYFHDV